MAFFLRDEFPEADMDRVVRMCLIHDLGEAFTGDIPTFEKTEADEQREETLLDAYSGTGTIGIIAAEKAGRVLSVELNRDAVRDAVYNAQANKRENMEFIADALGKKTNESAEETLNRYLNDGFFADHLKVYQKRPIYWLFTSGKNGGFKCLIYMHRYSQDTLARINGKYFLPESTRLKHDLEDIDQRLNVADGSERVRLEKERQRLMACYQEALAYGQVLDHMANKYIAIDLDDGVKVNYAKFQGVEMVTDGGSKVKMDLLAPLK
jgi:hypothetical protein